MMMKTERLMALTQLRGVSGQEDAVRDYLLREAQQFGDCRVDRLGNLIVKKKGERRAAHKLMLSAHMDEVGFLVTHIEKDGMLRFACVGGVSPAVTAGKPVEVGPKGLPGVIGGKPVHIMTAEEKKEYTKVDDMLIDIGANSREAAEQLVSVGDGITFVGEYQTMGGGRVSAKAIDDRAGCALLLELLRAPLPFDCTICFTVQEENGCLGAKTAAFAVQPEIAIAVEGTTASDLPGVDAAKRVCALGKGPVLSFMDKGTIYDRELYRRATAAADRANLPWQPKQGVYGGNESRSLQTAGEGAAVLAVSLPVRYLHAPAAVADLGDLDATLRLLLALVEEFCR